MTDLPGGWQIIELAELLMRLPSGRLIEQGWSPQCEKHPAPDDETWGVLKTTAIQPGRFAPEHNKTLPVRMEPRPGIEVHPGDLLLTSAGPRSRCGIPCLVRSTRPRLMMSGKMYRFRAEQSRVLPEYLELLLLSPAIQDRIDALKTGISDSGLNLTQARFLGMTVPVPPLGEQRRIVDLLEDHLSRLDASGAYLQASRDRLGSLQRAVLRRELQACGNVPISPVQALLRQPITNGRSVPSKDGGFPVLRLTAIKDDGIDLRERKAGAWTAEEARSFLVREGDFLLARGNGSLRLVGRGALVGEVTEPVAYPDTVMRLRFNGEMVSPQYVALLWQSPIVRQQIESQTRTTAGIYKVNQGHLNGIELPIPSMADQRRVVRRVTDVQDGEHRLAEALDQSMRRGASLRRALLDAAFSGRLTGRSTDSEIVDEIAAQQPTDLLEPVG